VGAARIRAVVKQPGPAISSSVQPLKKISAIDDMAIRATSVNFLSPCRLGLVAAPGYGIAGGGHQQEKIIASCKE